MLNSLLLNLLLVSFAVAEETLTTTVHGNAWKYGTGGGLLGFVVLILDIMVFSTLFPSSLLPPDSPRYFPMLFHRLSLVPLRSIHPAR